MRSPEVRLSTNSHAISLRERLFAYVILVRLNRPIGILLLLWPSLWALWMAGNGQPRWDVVLIFMLGVALMRSAGCAVNDFADRNFDGKVARTRHRPLALGLIKPVEALAVFALLSLLAFGLVLLLDWKTISMSVVAVILAALYPFMKRFTHLPQLILGMAFGWAVPMAFVALTGSVSDGGWLLYLATIIWALIYDTEYAMVDREDDIKIGVKSTAILFAEYDRIVLGLLMLTMLVLLVMVGSKLQLGLYYHLGIVAGAGMFLRQQIMIRNREPQKCFAAFLNNNGFGMIIFVGVVLDYLLAG